MGTTKKPAQPTKVVTPESELLRFSYCHVFKPEAVEEGDDPKYSCALLIPKKSKKTLAMIKAAVDAAKQEGAATWGGKIPANLKLPLRDGDEERPEDEAYAGMYFLNASSKTKPNVVDENVQAILNADEFYSGCWGRASVKFYPFNTKGNRGIAVGLNNLQKLRDDENLGGNSSAEDDFGAGGDDDDMLG